MKARKFPSYDDAIDHLKSRGELKFYGRVGSLAEIYIYTLTVQGKVYHLRVFEDGLVEVANRK